MNSARLNTMRAKNEFSEAEQHESEMNSAGLNTMRANEFSETERKDAFTLERRNARLNCETSFDARLCAEGACEPNLHMHSRTQSLSRLSGLNLPGAKVSRIRSPRLAKHAMIRSP
eukprot:6492590-Amphidinium_carterae.1